MYIEIYFLGHYLSDKYFNEYIDKLDIIMLTDFNCIKKCIYRDSNGFQINYTLNNEYQNAEQYIQFQKMVVSKLNPYKAQIMYGYGKDGDFGIYDINIPKYINAYQ